MPGLKVGTGLDETVQSAVPTLQSSRTNILNDFPGRFFELAEQHYSGADSAACVSETCLTAFSSNRNEAEFMQYRSPVG